MTVRTCVIIIWTKTNKHDSSYVSVKREYLSSHCQPLSTRLSIIKFYVTEKLSVVFITRPNIFRLKQAFTLSMTNDL